MRILHVDKFVRRTGGAAVYMLELGARQQAAGHQVEFFGMQHPDNVAATYEAHFPPFVSLEPPPPGVRNRAVAAGRMVYSLSAAAGMAEVLDRFRPDVVHLHNIYHQLSPSILRPVAKRGIPAVLTAHDYKLVCPTYRLLSNGELCDACVGSHAFHATTRRCQNGSLAASLVLSVESSLHRWTKAYGAIGRFVAPSRFLAEQLRRGGHFPERVVHVPNYVDAERLVPREGAGDGVVSIGRLSAEKGVDTLIRAVGRLEGATLTVAGDGPERAALERLAQVEAPGRVRFVGHVGADEVAALNRSARVAVLGARWHENMPLAVLETMAAAVPMVVSNLGGLPELVENGRDGLVVPPDDVDALAAAVGSLLADPSRSVELGTAARAKMLARFGAADHLEAIFGVYAEAAHVPGR